jgi:hypothetical protein
MTLLLRAQPPRRAAALGLLSEGAFVAGPSAATLTPIVPVALPVTNLAPATLSNRAQVSTIEQAVDRFLASTLACERRSSARQFHHYSRLARCERFPSLKLSSRRSQP